MAVPQTLANLLMEMALTIAQDDEIRPAYHVDRPHADLAVGLTIAGDACGHDAGDGKRVYAGLGGHAFGEGRYWHASYNLEVSPGVHVWEAVAEALNILMQGHSHRQGTRLVSWIDNQGIAYSLIAASSKDARVAKALILRQVALKRHLVEQIRTVWVDTETNELADATSHGDHARVQSAAGAMGLPRQEQHQLPVQLENVVLDIVSGSGDDWNYSPIALINPESIYGYRMNRPSISHRFVSTVRHSPGILTSH